MFLHIDESGNTGNNLFDQNQPVLSYGVLSSRWNVDAHAKKQHQAILETLGTDSIHANQLGPVGLEQIAEHLVELHQQYRFGFDYYFVDKPSFTVVTFFNAVFDAGINPAMKWDWYWTPLRFPVLGALSVILDEELRRESWRLCLIPRERLEPEYPKISALLSNVLDSLKESGVPTRFAEVLGDALNYGVDNPHEMDFGIYSPTALSPNTIGFQFVLTAIAYRQKRHKQKALGITVDLQTQFNGAQVQTYEIQSKIASSLRGDGSERDRLLTHPFLSDVREDTETLIDHFPEERLAISASDESFGLQLVDTYLWLANRSMKGLDVPRALQPVIDSVMSEGMTDGISMAAMTKRWRAFEGQLPEYEDVSAEHQKVVQDLIDRHRKKVESLKKKTS